MKLVCQHQPIGYLFNSRDSAFFSAHHLRRLRRSDTAYSAGERTAIWKRPKTKRNMQGTEDALTEDSEKMSRRSPSAKVDQTTFGGEISTSTPNARIKKLSLRCGQSIDYPV